MLFENFENLEFVHFAPTYVKIKMISVKINTNTTVTPVKILKIFLTHQW